MGNGWRGLTEVRRLTTGALFMTEVAAEHGVDMAACLSDSGLTLSSLGDPKTAITAEQELAVAGNLLRLLGDVPGLGLEVGARFRLSAYGIWGFALISSPTARAALELGMQFLDLSFALTAMQFREQDGEAQLVLNADHLAPQLRRFAIEREAAGARTLHADVLAVPPPLARMAFALPQPPKDQLGRYVEIFGLMPDFDAEETVLAYPAAVLDLPLPQANPVSKAFALEECRTLLDQRRVRSGLGGQVRNIVLDRLADSPTSTDVAASLHMSDRYLRRRLASEGTSFRELFEEVRERMAEEFLATGIPVEQVARRLGYVEVSSFSQAFRRWKGISPRGWREARRA